MSVWLILLTLIQTREPYELIKIDFIGLFERFTYKNIYIYNLVDSFSKYIYLYSTFGVGTNNIISLFDYYVQANFKPYAVYINAGLYFTSQKLCTYFQEKDIAVVFALFTSYKSICIIEKSNNIL